MLCSLILLQPQDTQDKVRFVQVRVSFEERIFKGIPKDNLSPKYVVYQRINFEIWVQINVLAGIFLSELIKIDMQHARLGI